MIFLFLGVKQDILLIEFNGAGYEKRIIKKSA